MLDYLNDLDRHIGSLLRANQAHIGQSDRHVAASFAQIAGGDREGQDNTLLPRSAVHRARR